MDPPSPIQFIVRTAAPLFMLVAGLLQLRRISENPRAACDELSRSRLERLRDLLGVLLIVFPVAAGIVESVQSGVTWQAIQHLVELFAWTLAFHLQTLEMHRFLTWPLLLRGFAVLELLLLIEQLFVIFQQPTSALQVILIVQYCCIVTMAGLGSSFRRPDPAELWWNRSSRFRRTGSVVNSSDLESPKKAPKKQQLAKPLLDGSKVEEVEVLPVKGPLSAFVRQTDIIGKDNPWTFSDVLGMSQYCVFTLRVKWDKRNIWEVRRRFTDFQLLRSHLHRGGFRAPDRKSSKSATEHPTVGQREFAAISEVLPVARCECCRKKVPSMDAMVQSLNVFLQEVLTVPEAKWDALLRAFLADGRVIVQEGFADALSIYDFQLLSVVGKGSYGKVMQAKKKDSGKIYAIKVLLKKDLKKQNQIQHTQTERHILGAVAHPFICSLRYAFQTQSKLYMVMDFFNGGELFFHLNKGAFDEARTRFYIAELVLALAHLHSQCVVYRDLKPENVLLDSDGHIKLTDFGLSKKFKPGQLPETRTFCGTPQYVAPEVVYGKGYGYMVDWWALGCLTFELLTRKPPFEAKNTNTLYNLIQHSIVSFPMSMSQTAKGFISGLLQKNPAQRLGFNGVHEIQQHPFFEGLDWKHLLERRLEVPFKPHADLEDTSNVWQEFLDDDVKDTPVDAPLSDSLDRNLPGFTFAPQSMMTLVSAPKTLSEDIPE